MKSLLPGLLLVACQLVACADTRRAGGPGSGGFTPTPRRDAAAVDTADDAAAEVPTSPADADPVEPLDAGVSAGDAGVHDAGVAWPDATFDAGPPPDDAGPPPDDAGPPPDVGPPTFPDAAAPVDASPSTGTDAAVAPAQTQVGYPPMAAAVRFGTFDVDATFTLDFANAGPGADTLTLTQVFIFAPGFQAIDIAVAPAVYVAPVGVSQATFRMVAGSANPAPTAGDLRSFCVFSALVPTRLHVTVSNGETGFINAQVTCP